MAKSGVIGLARSAAAELCHDRIRVNAIAPGSIPTGMTAHVATGDADNVDAIRDRLDRAPLLGRVSSPDDIANAVLFFFSDEGSWITGQTLVVDGGQTAAPPMVATWSENRMVIAR